MSWSSNQSPHHLINKASLSVAQFYFFAPFWFNLLNYCDENPRAHQFQKYSNQSTKNATVRNIEGSQLHEWLTWTFVIYRIVHAVLNCLYFFVWGFVKPCIIVHIEHWIKYKKYIIFICILIHPNISPSLKSRKFFFFYFSNYVSFFDVINMEKNCHVYVFQKRMSSLNT